MGSARMPVPRGRVGILAFVRSSWTSLSFRPVPIERGPRFALGGTGSRAHAPVELAATAPIHVCAPARPALPGPGTTGQPPQILGEGRAPWWRRWHQVGEPPPPGMDSRHQHLLERLVSGRSLCVPGLVDRVAARPVSPPPLALVRGAHTAPPAGVPPCPSQCSAGTPSTDREADQPQPAAHSNRVATGPRTEPGCQMNSTAGAKQTGQRVFTTTSCTRFSFIRARRLRWHHVVEPFLDQTRVGWRMASTARHGPVNRLPPAHTAATWAWRPYRVGRGRRWGGRGVRRRANRAVEFPLDRDQLADRGPVPARSDHVAQFGGCPNLAPGDAVRPEHRSLVGSRTEPTR